LSLSCGGQISLEFSRLLAVPLAWLCDYRGDVEDNDGLTGWVARCLVVSGNVVLGGFDYQPDATQHPGDQTCGQQGRSSDALHAILQDDDPQPR
jgi:hypothetical protein